MPPQRRRPRHGLRPGDGRPRRCSPRARGRAAARARRVPARWSPPPPSCARRTGWPATWRSSPAPTTASTTPAGCCRRATRSRRAAPPPGCWLVDATRTVLRQRPAAARRQRAGADVSARTSSAPARRRSPADRGDEPRHRPAGLGPLTAGARAAPTARCSVGGVDLRDLAAEHGTPACVLDEADLRARCRDWRDAFADGDVYYAGKAFLCIAVAPLGRRGGARPGRVHRRRAGRRAARPACRRSGCLPRQQQVARRARAGASTPASAGSSSTRPRRSPGSASLADRRGVRQRVYVRVTPGVEAHTHEFIATGARGPEVRLLAGRPVPPPRRSAGWSRCRRSSWSACTATSARTSSTAAASRSPRTGWSACSPGVRDEHGLELPELDLGGGLGIAYTRRRPDRAAGRRGGRGPAPAGRRGECADAGLAVPRLVVEPGRAVAGPDHRHALRGRHRQGRSPGLRTYVSVDGGMSDNIRTALYDAQYTAALASRQPGGAEQVVTAVRQALRERRHRRAATCTCRPTSPRATWSRSPVDRGLPPRRWRATTTTSRDRPSSAVRDGAARVMVRRETVDDLLARGPAGDGARPLRVALLGCGTVGSEVVRLLDEQRERPRRPGGRAAGAGRHRGAPPASWSARCRRPVAAHDRRRRPGRPRRRRRRGRGHRRHRAGPDPAARRAGGRPAASSRPTRRCWPRTARACYAGARESAAPTSTSRRRWPARSRCCGRCASRSPATGSRRVLGIVNGTTNFILTRMDETGATFADALDEATALGYAEADPTADVEGFDAAAKAAILAGHRLPHPGDRRRRAPRGHHRGHRRRRRLAPGRSAARSSCSPSASAATDRASACGCTRR